MIRKEAGNAKDFIDRLSTDSWKRLSRWARAVAFRHRFDSIEADDLLHEAFRRLLEKNPRLESEETFRAYLLATIRGIAFDLSRRRHMQIKHGLSEVEQWVIEDVPAESQEYEIEDVAKLLSRLPPRERDVAELTLQGLNTREVGERVGIEPSTVRSLLRRIRARFAGIA